MFGLRVKLHILLRIIDVFFLHNLENNKKNNRGVDCERESPRLFELIGLINCLVIVLLLSLFVAQHLHGACRQIKLQPADAMGLI